MKLSAAGVEKIKPTDKRQEIPDSLCVGLYLIVQPTGKKGWQVRYRHGGVHRRMSLGAFPVLSLAGARERARQTLAAASAGTDPAAEVKAAKAPKLDGDRDKIKTLIGQFDKRHLSKLKSGAVVRRELERHVVSAWGERDVHQIGKRDVIDLLDGIADSGRVVTANRVRAYLAKFFGWCVERDILATSPAAGVKPAGKETSRARVLTDDEIRWFWTACEAEGFPWGPFGKVLLLTGQRLNEVAQMTDSEIRGDLWHLTADRTKNGRAHDVPLTGAVRAALDEVERVTDEEGRVRFIFTTTGRTPVSGFFQGPRCAGRGDGGHRAEGAGRARRDPALDLP
ncbi:tyrosine-type recombinase/integrase [Cereibacter sphaeroides]|uniref:tyrosine-type recombinase/integrase n=1 Tax=Cereibacter sphaeroides TaxID=1063 RepID=UPI000B3204C8|nr:integrase family protein [Cereibacter sphaeroides]